MSTRTELIWGFFNRRNEYKYKHHCEHNVTLHTASPCCAVSFAGVYTSLAKPALAGVSPRRVRLACRAACRVAPCRAVRHTCRVFQTRAVQHGVRPCRSLCRCATGESWLSSAGRLPLAGFLLILVSRES